jgi:hypothetical protein
MVIRVVRSSAGYSLSVQPSPLLRRVAVHMVAFGACSDFTHVTAPGIARPPCVDFVARLRPCRLPGLSARQLSNLMFWVISSAPLG